MAQAKRDQNKVTTALGVSSVDGVTPVNIVVDSISNRVLLKQGASGTHGSVTNRNIAYRDQNKVPVLLGISSADGSLLMPVVEGNNLRFNND